MECFARVAAKIQLIDAGVIRVPRDNDLAARLKELYDGVMEVLAEHKPQCFAMEQLYSHYERPRTAILMGHARGVICLAAAMSGIEVSSLRADQSKKNSDRQRSRPKEPDARRGPASVAIAQRHRTARRGGRVGDRAVPYSSSQTPSSTSWPAQRPAA